MRLDKVFGLISGLSGTYRFSNAKLIHDESVLEHLGCVALLALLVLLEIRADSGTVDPAETLSKAVVHDVEEVLMGDVPRTTKYHDEFSMEAFKKMESLAMVKIFQSLELTNTEFYQLHQSAKNDLSGLIVKICDVMAVVYKIHEEVIERHNRSMMSRASTTMGQLEKCRVEIDKYSLKAQPRRFLVGLIEQAERIVAEAESVASSSQIAE